MRISDWSSDVCSSDLSPGDYPFAKRLAGCCPREGQDRDFGPVLSEGRSTALRPTSVGSMSASERTPHNVIARRNSASNDRIMRSEEHTSELQSLMRISYAVVCLKKKKDTPHSPHSTNPN